MPFFSIIIAHHVTIVFRVMFWSMPAAAGTAKRGAMKQ